MQLPPARLLLCAPLLFAAARAGALRAADTAPPAPLPDEPATQPADEQVWQLTSYLKGTPPQIREKLNGETERLAAMVREATQDIADTSREIEAGRQAAVERAKKAPEYHQLQAAVQAAEEQRKKAEGQERLEASSRFNKARLALENMERDAVTTDRALSDERKHLRELKADLKHHQEALDRARAWRDHLLAAIRTGFQIRAPVDEKMHGILGSVTPRKILPDGSVSLDYDAFELMGKPTDEEGIQKYSAVVHRVHLLVTGIDTKQMKEGQPVSLDRNFVVDRLVKDPRVGDVYVLRPKAAGLDHLLEVLIPLRAAPPTPAPTPPPTP